MCSNCQYKIREEQRELQKAKEVERITKVRAEAFIAKLSELKHKEAKLSDQHNDVENSADADVGGLSPLILILHIQFVDQQVDDERQAET